MAGCRAQAVGQRRHHRVLLHARLHGQHQLGPGRRASMIIAASFGLSAFSMLVMPAPWPWSSRMRICTLGLRRLSTRSASKLPKCAPSSSVPRPP
jgi:hypothetical protein